MVPLLRGVALNGFHSWSMGSVLHKMLLRPPRRSPVPTDELFEVVVGAFEVELELSGLCEQQR